MSRSPAANFELLSGVFGARARVVRLRLGDEQIELTEFLRAARPADPRRRRSNDRGFQHVAIIVRDMDAAYRRLREHRVGHASTGPQRLPDWNVNAGGIEAFYFRDPDGHFLEVLEFPPGKGLREVACARRRRCSSASTTPRSWSATPTPRSALLSRHARPARRRRERELRHRAGAPEQRVRRAAAHHGLARAGRARRSSCSNTWPRRGGVRPIPTCAPTTSRTGRSRFRRRRWTACCRWRARTGWRSSRRARSAWRPCRSDSAPAC